MQIIKSLTAIFAIGAAIAMAQSGTENGIGVEALVHSGVAVTDLDRALHFYVDQLGLKEAFRLTKPDGTPRLLYLQVNDDTFVEIFPGVTRTPPKSPATFHIGLAVKNLQTALHALQAKGYPLPANAFERAAKLADDGTYYYVIHDPDGNYIELSQINAESKQAKASKTLMKLAQSAKEDQ